MTWYSEAAVALRLITVSHASVSHYFEQVSLYVHLTVHRFVYVVYCITNFDKIWMVPGSGYVTAEVIKGGKTLLDRLIFETRYLFSVAWSTLPSSSRIIRYPYSRYEGRLCKARIFHWEDKTAGPKSTAGVGFVGRGSNPLPTS